ncbi:unannotated protein [freshwater metagenome]|uniref:Unannotated protein n=1 Tax=freshwater metagenome TaxID=449393 RepID=A0A6J7LZC7_9ZZZZ
MNEFDEPPLGSPVLQGGGAASATTSRVPALLAEGLAKTFNGRTVLHPFTLRVMPGEIHALIGQNGSGKSTLIKILSGFHTPDPGGNCHISGEPLEFGNPHASTQIGLRFVHQELGLIGSVSILDNLAFTRGFETRMGTICRSEENERAKRALATVGMDTDPRVLVASLTPAQRTGVAVARAIQSIGGQAAVLVLDEPTATLPTEEVEHLHAMLRRAATEGVGILYVTHHLDEVFQLASQVSVLRDGFLVESCSVHEIDRATIVHRLVGSELEAVQRVPHESLDGRNQSSALKVEALETDFIHGVTLEVNSGEIVGVYGLTGSGRESLLGAVFGALPRYSGTVTIDGTTVPAYRPAEAIKAGIGYLAPDRKASGGFMHLNATENLTLVDLKPFWKRGFLRNRPEVAVAREWFARLQVRPAEGTSAILSSFSGGNQQKIILGKWLRTSPKALLLDEPTQGVDVGAKAELHRQIIKACDAGAAIVVSSSDVEELASLCDRVLIMRNGRIAVELTGEHVNEVEINRNFLGVDETTSVERNLS